MDDVHVSDVVFAVDIGGTSTRAALVSSDGVVVARDRMPTEPARGIEDAARRTGKLLLSLAKAAGSRPLAAGVSTAGPVDPSTGTYDHPPNLPGWHDRSMVPMLREALDVPVVVGHDATLAAVAETRYGPHRGARDLVYLTVSTGIGAGIVSGGRPVTGSHGGAGEAGHLIVDPGGAPCGAGCPGCLEGVASGSALAAEARRRMQAGEPSTLPSSPSAIDVFAAARQGDPLAVALIDRALGHLASGIAGLLALLDPEVIVLGGGVAEGLAGRWDDLLREVAVRALPRYREGVPVVRTTLGDEASLLGAAALAFEAAGQPRSTSA